MLPVEGVTTPLRHRKPVGDDAWRVSRSGTSGGQALYCSGHAFDAMQLLQENDRHRPESGGREMPHLASGIDREPVELASLNLRVARI